MNWADMGLAMVIVLALFFDLKSRRIPNWIIITGLVAGLTGYGLNDGWDGIILALQGLAAGILLLIIPFLMGGIGAGDVKLLGIVGVLKGYIFALNTFLWMALWGGLIALIILIYQKQLKQTLKRLGRGLLLAYSGAIKLSSSVSTEEFHIYFPYALAIALGAASSYLIRLVVI